MAGNVLAMLVPRCGSDPRARPGAGPKTREKFKPNRETQKTARQDRRQCGWKESSRFDDSGETRCQRKEGLCRRCCKEKTAENVMHGSGKRPLSRYQDFDMLSFAEKHSKDMCQ
jgi:hypothetical protein